MIDQFFLNQKERRERDLTVSFAKKTEKPGEANKTEARVNGFYNTKKNKRILFLVLVVLSASLAIAVSI